MNIEFSKEKIVQFIESKTFPNVKYSSIQRQELFRVNIIKHCKSGKFLPRCGRTSPSINTFLKSLHERESVIPGLMACFEDDPWFNFLDVEMNTYDEALELCYWLVDKYRDSDKLLTPRGSSFFFKTLSSPLIELIDGAVAGDGGIYQKSKQSAIFIYTLEIKQLGHLEEFKEELVKHGYRFEIRYYKSYYEHLERYIETCSITWTLKAFLLHRQRWYDDLGQKKLPADVLNSSTFWRWFYAGDGCLYVISPYSYRILISSNDFSTNDVDRLIFMLSEHGIKSTRYLKRYGNTGKPQWILTINSHKHVDKFLAFIGKPVKSLEYKWERPIRPKIQCKYCKTTFEKFRGDSEVCNSKCGSKYRAVRYRNK